jgi:hypothetical protein
VLAVFDFTGFVFMLSENQPQKRGFAGAVAANETDLSAVCNRCIGPVQDGAAGDPDGHIVKD